VTLIDCIVTDLVRIVDLIAHALDNPPPATVVLISGDRDFVYAVSILRLRKYNVVLLAPSAVHSSLRQQVTIAYEWPRSVLYPDVATPMPLVSSRPRAYTNSRPSAQPLDPRPTASMIRISSSPPTPQSSNPMLPTTDESSRSDFAQHNRSTSLPNSEIAALARASSSAFPARHDYSTAVAGVTPPSFVCDA
jgi:hypothetical protein